MKPLEELRAKIAGFPGYGSEMQRRLSDEYVRSYLGEALAALAARCTLEPQVRERLDDLIMRVGFADPHAFSNRPTPAADADDDGGAVAEADFATVELADRAASLDAQAVSSYLDEAVALLDKRDGALRAAAKQMA
jgi:hypothetical protein